MASKNSYRAQQQQQPPANQPSNIPASARQNEYFVPRDGIDREVITSDICRYLGNDALVRPGTYEAPDGRVTQGYFITAYRNLTSAMIQDLKADSSRWEAERRAASGRPGGAGGTIHYSSQPNGNFRRSSNSPLAGSREQTRGQSDYSTWKNRQQREQDAFVDTTYGGMAMDIDSYPAPPVLGASKTSGYGAGPYSAAQMSNYPAVSYPPQILPGAGQYPAQPYGYPTNPPTQYSPGPQSGDRYTGMAGPPAMAAQYGQDSSFIHGSNYQTSPPGYVTSGPITRIRNLLEFLSPRTSPTILFMAAVQRNPPGKGMDSPNHSMKNTRLLFLKPPRPPPVTQRRIRWQPVDRQMRAVTTVDQSRDKPNKTESTESIGLVAQNRNAKRGSEQTVRRNIAMGTAANCKHSAGLP
ncbi:hypothetical protein B0T22DRAFT_508827 [Podospora appendiculata]|uniref:Transcription factor RfeG n=1 Tax=Podospora appendiculata TaxID=314037 RepID=A0AAE1CIG3_9PEZI|nr:hypothetical protein B0T22DRAFT_508827 [Podospora appendiculata]